MSQIVLQGDVSGSAIITTPSAAGTPTLTLPTTSGTILTTATGQTLTSPVISGTPTGVGVLTAGTAVASTSGTSIDFTGIPSWVRRITVTFNGVSTNGTSVPQIQLGAGSVTTSGYLGSASVIVAAVATATGTSGFFIAPTGNWAAATTVNGSCTINLLSSSTNTWSGCGIFGASNASSVYLFGGSIALSGTLDRIRITTVNGTDTFDAGSINILYE